MSDPFPAVAEAAATGQIADLFADIRATVGVRVVNLVWRHLATIDGALPWAWAAVKPLYLQGVPDEAAREFRAAMALPYLEGLAGPQPQSVDDVLESYDHSNTMNLFALGALLAWFQGYGRIGDVVKRGPRLPSPNRALPPLASEADIAPSTWAAVVRLNGIGDRRPLILASMYRHLAHAPAFLAELERALKLAEISGELDQAILKNKSQAARQARKLAGAIHAPEPMRANEIETAVLMFIDHAIGKMVTICRAIRVARESV